MQISRHGNETLDENTLWDEITLIHPDISPNMREYLTTCIEINRKTPIPKSTQTDILVQSLKYGLFGRIDKFHEKEKYLSTVRNSHAPSSGCWPLDRVRTAAYLLCLKETSGITLKGGYVEYIPDGIIRYCEPQPQDRRKLLQGLKEMREIQNGGYPKRPLNAPCKKCRHLAQCEKPIVTKLSDLLFKKRE